MKMKNYCMNQFSFILMEISDKIIVDISQLNSTNHLNLIFIKNGCSFNNIKVLKF